MVTIQYFAALKDYFPIKESFEVNNITVKELRKILIRNNPACEGVLNSCRFAVDLSFVNDEYIIKSDETISVIPPAGGG
jgi:molybdopterin synthase sulfur carrier subunit